MLRIALLSSVAVLGTFGAASASPIAVNNPSFEDLVLTCAPGPTCFALGDVPSWGASAATGGTTFKPSTGPSGEFISIPDGVNVAAVAGPGTNAHIFQAVNANVQSNTLYTLQVSVGHRADFPFSEYTVDLEAGGTVLVSDSSLSPGPGSFVTDTLTFFSGLAPPSLGQQLGIRLSATGLSATGASAQADFDLVHLDASPSAVPTPLIGFGFPAFLVVGGLLFGAKLLEGAKKLCSLESRD
jgi:hypothetical protein